ncbi:MAG: hypothetical protein HC880_12545, partial [Bacteroidia bacterium]|nr:hypothetical protein [Bacteroidia bacterium]
MIPIQRMMASWLILLGLIFYTPVLWASDVVEVLPLTNQILMLRFDDGYVRHHTRGERRDNEWAVINPLNLTAADLLNSYSIVSTDD